MAARDAQADEVLVPSQDREIAGKSRLPEADVARTAQDRRPHVNGSRSDIRKRVNENFGQVLVDQELHRNASGR